MRILGTVAMGLGLIGLTVGLVIAGGTWLVKTDIQARVHALVSDADAGIERVIGLTDTLEAKLIEVSGGVSDIKARADEQGDTSAIDPTVATSLATAIDAFVSGPYATLRTDYVALRERVATLGEALQALDSAVPAVTLPGAVMERLQAIDARLTQFDSTVSDVALAGTQGLSEPGIASKVSELAGAAEEDLATIGQLVTGVRAALQETRGQLAGIDEGIALFLTVGAGAGIIAGLYLAGLNILLVQQGRRWRRRAPSDLHGSSATI